MGLCIYEESRGGGLRLWPAVALPFLTLAIAIASRLSTHGPMKIVSHLNLQQYNLVYAFGLWGIEFARMHNWIWMQSGFDIECIINLPATHTHALPDVLCSILAPVNLLLTRPSLRYRDTLSENGSMYWFFTFAKTPDIDTMPYDDDEVWICAGKRILNVRLMWLSRGLRAALRPAWTFRDQCASNFLSALPFVVS